MRVLRQRFAHSPYREHLVVGVTGVFDTPEAGTAVWRSTGLNWWPPASIWSTSWHRK